MPIDFYQEDGCPGCLAVKLAINHLKIAVNYINVDLAAGEHLKQEFLKINPAHILPTIVDDGFALWESRAINRYLLNQYAPSNDLYPNDLKKRAIVDRMLDFDLGSLYTSATHWIFPVVFANKPKDDKKEKAMSEKLKLFDHLLSKSQYSAGDNLTIADFSLLATVSMIYVTGHNLNQYQNVKFWMNRLDRELPYYKKLMEPHFDALNASFVSFK
ncbi:glutathione S-transferase 1-1-like protein [Dinothrombium tinctorium]|uniref:Glutathione S-transferase 1-1-like protein n=1 Tax=Dinothrombium tinctorium TaxID=1965070 RepID=A0A443QUN5_9ACAR|nr:glutathione S-transferase 1-1-like protein [Dinothrombium tinctorium]